MKHDKLIQQLKQAIADFKANEGQHDDERKLMLSGVGYETAELLAKYGLSDPDVRLTCMRAITQFAQGEQDEAIYTLESFVNQPSA